MRKGRSEKNRIAAAVFRCHGVLGGSFYAKHSGTQWNESPSALITEGF